MATKTIFLPQNLNNKLNGSVMVHLDLAPWAAIPERLLDNNVVEFQTQDNSYPPTRWQLVDLYRTEFGKVSSIITWPSHGMDVADCYSWIKKIHPELNTQTPMAIYYYKKII